MQTMTQDPDRAGNRLPVDESREHLMLLVARMTYQQDKTLTEAEIEAVSAKIIEKVTKATGGSLRA